MATEQDWASYANQAYLAANDTILARTNAGAGVEIAGQYLFARQASGGLYKALGKAAIADSSAMTALESVGGASPPRLLIADDAPTTSWTADTATELIVVRDGNCGVSMIAGAGGANALRFGDPDAEGAGAIFYLHSGDYMRFDVSAIERFRITSAALLPGATDNIVDIGSGTYRFQDGFFANGITTTSDERQKIWLDWSEDRRARDRRIARRIMDEFGWFQWIKSVGEKGPDDARWFFGTRAQRVWKIFADEGVCAPIIGEGRDQRPDPDWDGPPPALLCYDSWERDTEQRPVYSKTVLDESGEPALIRVDTVVVREAGSGFGYRKDQLDELLIWALHERLLALEAGAAEAA